MHIDNVDQLNTACNLNWNASVNCNNLMKLSW